MRRGQITIFVLLGMVLLISVVVLIFARQAIRAPSPQPEVTADVTLARSCLQRVTDSAVRALEDDGVITIDEGGPLPEETHHFVSYTAPVDGGELMLGENTFIGLCNPDPEAPNGLGVTQSQRFTCDNLLYHYHPGDVPSVQEQLETRIGRQMTECVNLSADVQLIIQEDGLVIRWSEPEIQYSPKTPLHLAFRAVQEIVGKEISRPGFSPNRTVNGAYVDRELDCEECDLVRFYPDPKALEDNGTDWYIVNVSGDAVVRFGIEDRGVVHGVEQGGDVVPEAADFLSGDCTAATGLYLTPSSTQQERESVFRQAKHCNNFTFFSFDDDKLHVGFEDTPANARFEAATQTSSTCTYDFPAGSGIPDRTMQAAPSYTQELIKPLNRTGTSIEEYYPHINTLVMQRAASTIHEPILTITDNDAITELGVRITPMGSIRAVWDIPAGYRPQCDPRVVGVGAVRNDNTCHTICQSISDTGDFLDCVDEQLDTDDDGSPDRAEIQEVSCA